MAPTDSVIIVLANRVSLTFVRIQTRPAFETDRIGSVCLSNCVCYIVSSGFSYCYSLRYVFHFVISFLCVCLLPLTLSLSLSLPPVSVCGFRFCKIRPFYGRQTILQEFAREWNVHRCRRAIFPVRARPPLSRCRGGRTRRQLDTTSPTVFALILEFNELAVINISRRDSSLVVTRLFVPRRLRLIASTVRSRSRLIVVCSSVSSASVVSRVENTIGASLLISHSSPF